MGKCIKAISVLNVTKARSTPQWPGIQRRGSTAASLLGLRVRIPTGKWMLVSSVCCVLPRSVLCDGPIPHPE